MTGFRHAALLYRDEADFVSQTTRFVEDGLAAGDPVLVAVPAAKIDLLRAALGPGASAVRFEDITVVGRNPACILPLWADFVRERGADGRRLRGIGEPAWPGRAPDEVAECHVHESLLNVAFDGGPAWDLVCPYDVGRLDPAVVGDALATHPLVAGRASDAYRGASDGWLSRPLPPVPPGAAEMPFDRDAVGDVRRFVRRQAGGLPPERLDDLVLAVDEVVTNSIRHGGGAGVVRLWRGPDRVVCEVHDGGRFDRPLAGRVRPGLEQEGGRGLWLVNQVCDLVQMRSLADGTTVRLHVAVA